MCAAHNDDRADQKRLSWEAHRKYTPARRFLALTALGLVPLLVGFRLVLPNVASWLGITNWTAGRVIGIGVLILLFWIWIAWLYRSLYRRPMWIAMRAAGYEVCVGCGYRLDGQPDDATCCPECGTPSERRAD